MALKFDCGRRTTSQCMNNPKKLHKTLQLMISPPPPPPPTPTPAIDKVSISLFRPCQLITMFTKDLCKMQRGRCVVHGILRPKYAPKIHIWPYLAMFGHSLHIWARQIWSSEVSLKRSCKMQFRCVTHRSIGPSSQKL